MENVTLWLADLIADIVAPSSPRYPLFDDAPDGLLATMIRQGKSPGARLGEAAPAALTSRHIGRLDAFPDAPMRAVLEARESLRAPLTRFREAIATMQAELESIPLDEAFDRAVHDRYERLVAPTLRELEDLAKELNIGSLLGRDLLTGGSRHAEAPALSLTAATVGELPGLAALALGVGLDVGAASVYKTRAELRDRQKENRILFLYEAGATPQI
jgi:hypothetical protein